MLAFTVPDTFDPGLHDPDLVAKRSKHYLTFMLLQRCVGCLGLRVKQQDRTTAHHIRNAGVARKCPDFLTVPVEYRRHVVSEGRESIDGMGKKSWLVHHGLPEYEQMARFYLAVYLSQGWYKRTLTTEGKLGKTLAVPPAPEDFHSAVFYYNQLTEQLA